MSHYTVTVRVSKERLARHNQDVEEAIAEMLAPYDESTEDERFVEFDDEEDSYREEYENETCTRIRMDDGTLLWPWDERFRVPGTLGTGSGTHRPPEDRRVEVPFKEVYADFETFCAEYHSSKRDARTGRHGYWRNPNNKWDWYVIGGCWSGFYKLGDVEADQVWTSQLNLAALKDESFRRAGEFYDEYMAWLAEPTHGWDTPRAHAMNYGLVTVDQTGTAAPADGVVLVPWAKFTKPDDSRSTWIDVCRAPSRSDFLETYGICFHPLQTFAALDEEGWHEPGKMGWFAMSSDTPESKMEFCRGFLARFVEREEDALLVCVDCHI